MKSILSLSLTLLLNITPSYSAFNWEDHYDFETLKLPKNIDPQIGGLDLMSDGRLIACFHRGEVMIYDQKTKAWTEFADGLHEPLGIYAEKEGTILVIQRPEITRLHDTSGDGKADFYETICNDWGMTGNYHEFSFGLVKDSKGNIYISHGTASNGSGVRKEIRGEWNNAGGLTHERFLYDNSKEEMSWKAKKAGTPRMYARVPARGCIQKITPGNRKAEIYATGLRTPNGLYIDANDHLWVADNQGDWLGSSKLHRIEEGKFHGHPASLLWDTKKPVTDAIPWKIPKEELANRRVKEAGLLPQGECANSPGQILGLNENFVPTQNVQGTLIFGDVYPTNRLHHFYQDEVNGKLQGATCHVFTNSPVGGGNNRILFSKAGKSLFVGKTHLSWPGREGIKKVKYNGKPYLMTERLNLTPKGFEFTFNSDLISQ